MSPRPIASVLLCLLALAACKGTPPASGSRAAVEERRAAISELEQRLEAATTLSEVFSVFDQSGAILVAAVMGANTAEGVGTATTDARRIAELHRRMQRRGAELPAPSEEEGLAILNRGTATLAHLREGLAEAALVVGEARASGLRTDALHLTISEDPALGDVWREVANQVLPARQLQEIQIDLQTLEQAVRLFRLKEGRLPREEEWPDFLTEGSPRSPRAYIGGLPADPWGNGYVYRREAGNRFRVGSLGADGLPGGEGLDADVFSGERDR